MTATAKASEKIAKLRQKIGPKRILGLILVGVVLFSLCFEIINVENLFLNPFRPSYKWETPINAATNEEGYTAVLDSFGTRVTLIDPKGNVRTTVRYALFKNVSPAFADGICIDDDTITVVDHMPDIERKDGYYDRILVYDFNGKCTDIPYSDKKQKEISILSATVKSNTIYVAMLNNIDDRIIVGKISDGKVETIHKYKYDSDQVFGVRYNPIGDTTVLLTCRGDIVAWQGKDRNVLRLSKTEMVASDAIATDDGRLVAVDNNSDAIVDFGPVSSTDNTGTPEKLVSTEALNLSACGSVIAFADQNKGSIGTVNRQTGKVLEMKSARYSTGTRILCVATWAVFVLGVISLAILIVLFILAIVRKVKNSNKLAHIQEEPRGNGRLTNLKLYGPIMGTAFLAFAVTGIMIGGMFYNGSVDTSRATVENISASIMNLSNQGLGDDVEKIKNQNDYGSYEYNKLTASVSAICDGSVTFDATDELGWSLYKITDDSEQLMVIYDHSGQMRTGTKLSVSDQKTHNVANVVADILNGDISRSESRYSNGVKYYRVYSPIYNSKGRTVGISLVSLNETKFREGVLHSIMMKLIEAFTLLFGLLLLFVEFGLAGRFLRLKKQNMRITGEVRTSPEAFRTIEVVFRIPEAMFIIFINFMVEDILTVHGQENIFALVALPVTLNALAFFVCRIIAGYYVKYSPRNHAFKAAAYIIVASLILLMAMERESYMLLNLGATVMGLGSAVGTVTAKAIRLADLKPADRYMYMVFERKGILATAIAASIGTAMRAMFGKSSIVCFMIFIAIVAIAAAALFIENDINVPKDRKKVAETKREHLKIYKDMLGRPNTFVFLVLVAIPIPFLTLLGSYVLPQVNMFYGLPEVFIGAISLIVTAVTLLFSSFLWNVVIRKNDEFWPPVLMGALAVMLLIFSIVSTMKFFIIVLIAIALTESVLMPLSLKQIIGESGDEGHDARDMGPLHEFFSAIGALMGPALMSAMLMLDVRLIGIFWGVICGICAVAAYKIFSKAEREENIETGKEIK